MRAYASADIDDVGKKTKNSRHFCSREITRELASEIREGKTRLARSESDSSSFHRNKLLPRFYTVGLHENISQDKVTGEERTNETRRYERKREKNGGDIKGEDIRDRRDLPTSVILNYDVGGWRRNKRQSFLTLTN